MYQAQITDEADDSSNDREQMTVELDNSGNDVEFFAAALKGAQRNRSSWDEWCTKRSLDEMNQLKADNKCFKCTQVGHQTPDCKNKAVFQ